MKDARKLRLTCFASIAVLALASCDGLREQKPPTDGKTTCEAGRTACGSACCAPGERCVAERSACEQPTNPDQLAQCYSAAQLTAFGSDKAYVVDEDGFEYLANNLADSPYRQQLSVGLFPLSKATPLVGTFDLSKEPFSYATCEHCLLVIAAKSETDQKYYLANGGSLTITAADTRKISGSISGARLIQATIDETTLATKAVEGGCTVEIPSLSFSFDKGGGLDPRIEKCFVPESYGPDAFQDFIYEYEANKSGYFYRAIELPSAQGVPQATLFVEVYEDGTGSFNLAGAETNCATCNHFVIIDAQAPSGAMKEFVSASGTLVLTTLSDTAMAGRLEKVKLVETVISGSTFTPVPNGCTTYIERLEFDSRNATR